MALRSQHTPAAHIPYIPSFQSLGWDRGHLGSSYSPVTYMFCVIGRVPSPPWAVGRAETGYDQMTFKTFLGLSPTDRTPSTGHSGKGVQLTGASGTQTLS